MCNWKKNVARKAILAALQLKGLKPPFSLRSEEASKPRLRRALKPSFLLRSLRRLSSLRCTPFSRSRSLRLLSSKISSRKGSGTAPANLESSYTCCRRGNGLVLPAEQIKIGFFFRSGTSFSKGVKKKTFVFFLTAICGWKDCFICKTLTLRSALIFLFAQFF